MEEVRVSLTHRFGAKGIQETNFTNAGAEISQKKDLSDAISQKRPRMDSNYSRRLLNYGNIDNVSPASVESMIVDGNWVSSAG